MSSAWEVTTDDLLIVLDRHGVKKTEAELEQLLDDVIDADAIEDGVLYYTDMDDQVQSALSDIEDQLMEAGVIPRGDKFWNSPEELSYSDNETDEELEDSDEDDPEDDEE